MFRRPIKSFRPLSQHTQSKRNTRKGWKKIGKHFKDLNQHKAVLFWFLLLLTFLYVSYGSNTNTTSIYYLPYYNTHINNDSYTTQSTNISHNTTTTTYKIIPQCNPPTLTGIYDFIHYSLRSHGFNIQCKNESSSISSFYFKSHIQSPSSMSSIYHSCFTYNNNISIGNHRELFCDGGKLIHADVNWMRVNIDILKKTSLQRVLNTYCNKYHKNDNVCDFSLLTYNLGITKERNEFLTNHIDCNNNKPQYDKAWVFKENTDFGEGIHWYNNHQLIYQLIVSDISENIDNCTFQPIQNLTYFKQDEKFVNYHKIVNGSGFVIDRKYLVIQQFVSNPLLVKMYPEETIKHVFSLRTFFMIASYSNPFIVLFFPKPMFLINPHNYENKRTSKDIITNRKAFPEINSTDRFDYVWGPTQLQNYLNITYGKQLFDGDYISKLNNDIKHVLKYLFMANAYNNNLTKYKLFDSNNNYHFEMLCMDMIVTDQFELKLLEVNSHCGDGCHNRHKNEADWDCTNRYSEAARITMEVFKKKNYNQPIQKLDSLNHYEIAFWE